MNASIDSVINKINQIDPPSGRKRTLPDDELIEKYEKMTGFLFSNDYKKILKTVSNAFVGTLSLLTLESGKKDVYGELKTTCDEAHALGVPKAWLPICEDNGDYYCLTPNGTVRFWDQNGSSDETWPNLATWVQDVWLEDA
ncbi:SMI1/KNR4 family protein [Komagataeibacter oboediens]|uniref:SMI1/KNR4 family protein n=1 Tax=Komagataeibacter oboediens TaxID=65958 RepID=UPI0019073420|nr:SMI1/KNR4 family protein [Komagataeibacter oboediens]GCE80714.1 hypothetical protein MSKU3_2189 [Komagataeibacter oboediens]